MCRTEEESVNGVGSAHVTTPSIPSKEGAYRPLPLSPLPIRRPPPRPVTRARRVALVTLVCAAAAAIGAGRGLYGSFWWTVSSSGREEDGSGADLFNERLNISTSGVSFLEVYAFVRIFPGMHVNSSSKSVPGTYVLCGRGTIQVVWWCNAHQRCSTCNITSQHDNCGGSTHYIQL